MTEDHIWLRQQHNLLYEEIQRSRLYFAEAQEYRQNIAGIWNDACAHEVNSRFLNPMSEEASASLESMRLQHEAMVMCVNELSNAFRSFKAAVDNSILVNRHLDETRSIFRTIESFLNLEMAEIGTADGYADRARRLTDEADRIGDLAVSESSYRS